MINMMNTGIDYYGYKSMNKIKQSFFKLGIVIFSFLWIACASKEERNVDKARVNDVVSSEQKAARQQVKSQQKAKAKRGDSKAQVSDSVSSVVKAAESGDIEAQYWLGVLYYSGQGVSEDFKKAIYWFEKAAYRGHVGAQYELGWMYYYGRGVSKNVKKARYWFEKAAEQGHINAPHALSVIKM